MGSSRSGVQAIKRGKSFLVQVKTRLTYEKQLKSFVLGEKNEKFADENFFYCFVDLGLQNSKIYVVPSKRVSQILTESHSKWLSSPGKKGQVRNDSKMRKLRLDYSNLSLDSADGNWIEEYLENWGVFMS